MRRTLRTLAAIVLLGVAVGTCHGDTEPDQPTEPAPPRPAVTTTGTPADAPDLKGVLPWH
ncbi:hypothetical protein ACX6XY_17775 [Streptomyces sp. O3]